MSSLLRIDGVSVTFGRRKSVTRALMELDLSISEGDSVAIVGESGSGKTTLGRVILGLQHPTTGTVRWQGRDVREFKGDEAMLLRREIQGVFQNPALALDPRMRADALIVEPLETRRRMTRADRIKAAAELMEQVGLDPALVQRYPHQLSGGQRQRIAIARALSTRPSLLVFDEPTAALDHSAKAQILQVIRNLRRESGVAVVFITHDVSVVPLVADRVTVLYGGRVFEEFPVERLWSESGHNPYTRLLLDAVPKGPGSLRKHPPVRENSDDAGPRDRSGCPFWSRCPDREEICADSLPELVPVSADSRSRCHFALREDS